MKNQFVFPFLSLIGLFLLNSCKDKCAGGDYGIQSLQPAANPAGYEIFIAAKGVGADTEVRFDAVEAASVKTAEGGLIVKVPTGLSGVVSLSIQNGDCSDSRDFEVLGSYPGNVPPSPTSIIVPQTPGGYIGSVSNAWKNVEDELHSLFLQTDDNNPGHIIPNDGTNFASTEFHFGSNSFLNNNPISGTFDTLTNEILMVIDRSAKTGGYRDTLDGQFIQNLPQTPAAVVTMLLTSRRTGRQLVIYKEN